MADAPLTVLVVDDQVLFRQGLAGLLNSQADFRVVGEAGSVEEAVAQARRLCPQLVLLDFGLPDGTGVDATREILAHCQGTKVVILTVHEEDEGLFAAIRAGAKGYLLKNTRVERLLQYLRGLDQGQPALDGRMASRIIEAFARSPALATTEDSLATLSFREEQVLQEMARNATNAEIAQRLSISENTVKNHVRSILNKLGLNSRREAARYVASRRR